MKMGYRFSCLETKKQYGLTNKQGWFEFCLNRVNLLLILHTRDAMHRLLVDMAGIILID